MLTKSAPNTSDEPEPAKLKDSEESDDDSLYVNSYSNYSIHLEMLQARDVLSFYDHYFKVQVISKF